MEERRLPEKTTACLVTLVPESDSLYNAGAAISKLLHAEFCQLKDLGKLPESVSRLYLHGHGGKDRFGSSLSVFTSETLVQRLFPILKQYPNIREICILSCNVGVVPSSKKCFALEVQDLLDAYLDRSVDVKTFVTNDAHDIYEDVAFILGRGINKQICNIGRDEYAVYLYRKDDEPLQKILHEKNELDEAMYFFNEVNLLLQGILDEVRLDKCTNEGLLEKIMNRTQYSKAVVAKLIREYHISITPDNGVCFTLSKPQFGDLCKDYVLQYASDVRGIINKLDHWVQPFIDRMRSVWDKIHEHMHKTSGNILMKGKVVELDYYLTSLRTLQKCKWAEHVFHLSSMSTLSDEFTVEQLLGALHYLCVTRVEGIGKSGLDLYVNKVCSVFNEYETDNPARERVMREIILRAAKSYSDINIANNDPRKTEEVVAGFVNFVKLKIEEIKSEHRKPGKGRLSIPNIGKMFARKPISASKSDSALNTNSQDSPKFERFVIMESKLASKLTEAIEDVEKQLLRSSKFSSGV